MKSLHQAQGHTTPRPNSYSAWLPMVVNAGLFTLALTLALGCANERPFQKVLDDNYRVPRQSLQGTFLYLKSVTELSTPGPATPLLAPGMYLEPGRLVEFRFHQDAVELVSIDPLYHEGSAKEATRTLARFSARYVDVVPKQNSERENTQEEEVSETRRPWHEREYVVLDLASDSEDVFSKSLGAVRTSAAASAIQVSASEGIEHFSVRKTLQDDTQLTLKYAFRKYAPSSTYTRKEYSRYWKKKFGFFTTQALSFDKYGQVLQENLKEFIDRWDTSRMVVYTLSKGFPEHLKAGAHRVFAHWNRAFRAAVGHDVLVLQENSGQALGDLNANLIYFDDSPEAAHSILGYGPRVSDPRTGEILKADVILYGSVLKRSLLNSRRWATLQPTMAGRTLATGQFDALAESSPEMLERNLTSAASAISFPANLAALASLDGLKAAKAAFLSAEKSPALRWTTRLSPSHELAIDQAVASPQEVTDAEIEMSIFLPLLAHELGHNLGLRHNFMASADAKHFDEHEHSSSVMDYGFRASEEPAAPGPYDRAAIAVAYSNDSAKAQAAFDENFLFCTDEETFSSRRGKCLQFDLGTNLTEIVAKTKERYTLSYVINNLRLHRAFFGSADNSYIQRLFHNLLPLRVVYDHASAVLEAAGSKDFNALWVLLREEIEAKANTPKARQIHLEITDGFESELNGTGASRTVYTIEKTLDADKIKAAVEDAGKARKDVFQTFSKILFDANRPDFDLEDEFHGEIEQRGVIFDKVLSLFIFATATPHPLGNGGSIDAFSEMPGEMSKLLGDLITASREATDPSGKPALLTLSIQPALRHLALNLVRFELGEPNIAPEALELLASDHTSFDRTRIARATVLSAGIAHVQALSEAVKRVKAREQLEKILREETTLASLLPAEISKDDFIRDTLASLENNVPSPLARLESKLQTEAHELERAGSEEEQQFLAWEVRRAKFREALVDTYAVDTPPGLRKAAAQWVTEELQARKSLGEAAYVQLASGAYIRAPHVVGGTPLLTISGRMARDSVAYFEDILGATEKVIAREKKLLQELVKSGKPDAKKLAAYEANTKKRSELAEALRKMLFRERRFLEDLYRMYHP